MQVIMIFTVMFGITRKKVAIDRQKKTHAVFYTHAYKSLI